MVRSNSELYSTWGINLTGEVNNNEKRYGESLQRQGKNSFKITMKEYEDMAIKVEDKVRIEIKKADIS